MENDAVNHPSHYTGHSTEIECIMFTRNMSFDAGNAFKYIWRAGEKDDIAQDLNKALWYIDDAVAYGHCDNYNHLVPFLPRQSLHSWKYEALYCILVGNLSAAQYAIADKLHGQTETF